MANYTLTKVLDLTSDMKDSLEEILTSEQYHIDRSNKYYTGFKSSKKMAKNILLRLSKLYPDIEITTVTRYGGYYHSGEVYTDFYDDGEQVNIRFCRPEYTYRWIKMPLDEHTKRAFEEEIDDYFSKKNMFSQFKSKPTLGINKDGCAAVKFNEHDYTIVDFNINDIKVRTVRIETIIYIASNDKNLVDFIFEYECMHG